MKHYVWSSNCVNLLLQFRFQLFVFLHHILLNCEDTFCEICHSLINAGYIFSFAGLEYELLNWHDVVIKQGFATFELLDHTFDQFFRLKCEFSNLNDISLSASHVLSLESGGQLL